MLLGAVQTPSDFDYTPSVTLPRGALWWQICWGNSQLPWEQPLTLTDGPWRINTPALSSPQVEGLWTHVLSAPSC